jgi:hypothetical protein
MLQHAHKYHQYHSFRLHAKHTSHALHAKCTIPHTHGSLFLTSDFLMCCSHRILSSCCSHRILSSCSLTVFSHRVLSPCSLTVLPTITVNVCRMRGKMDFNVDYLRWGGAGGGRADARQASFGAFHRRWPPPPASANHKSAMAQSMSMTMTMHSRNDWRFDPTCVEQCARRSIAHTLGEWAPSVVSADSVLEPYIP